VPSKLGGLPLIDDGKYLLQPVWVQDVAEAIVGCVDNEWQDSALRVEGKTLELAGPEEYTWREVCTHFKCTLVCLSFLCTKTHFKVGIDTHSIRTDAHFKCTLVRTSVVYWYMLQCCTDAQFDCTLARTSVLYQHALHV
jgi:hypothetical protein